MRIILDRSTGAPATAYTPPEDMVTVTSLFLPECDDYRQDEQLAWLRQWSRQVAVGVRRVRPSLAVMVHDLLVNGRGEWPALATTNVFDLRVRWGDMMRLSPAPWCTHGRYVGPKGETCVGCFRAVNDLTEPLDWMDEAS